MSLDALLVGRMTQAGETARTTLRLGAGLVGGAGALALGSRSLWLAQPQLMGGPSVASVPLAEVGPGSLRTSRWRGRVLVLSLNGREVRFPTPATAEEAGEFLRVLDLLRE